MGESAVWRVAVLGLVASCSPADRAEPLPAAPRVTASPGAYGPHGPTAPLIQDVTGPIRAALESEDFELARTLLAARVEGLVMPGLGAEDEALALYGDLDRLAEKLGSFHESRRLRELVLGLRQRMLPIDERAIRQAKLLLALARARVGDRAGAQALLEEIGLTSDMGALGSIGGSFGPMPEGALPPEEPEGFQVESEADYVSIERYPTVEAPARVMPGVEFAVQVALTEQALTPEVGENPVSMLLPDSDAWMIEVVLSGRGFGCKDGRNSATIRLPRGGDSSPALFWVTADEEGAAERPLWVTFYYGSRFLHRARRLVSVGSGAAAETQESLWENAAGAPSAFSLTFAPGPDLTIEIVGDRVRARGNGLASFEAPHVVSDESELSAYLGTRYAQLASAAGRGLSVTDPSGAREIVRGIGRELYRRFAPEAFKRAFWFQVDALGERFDSIQINSDDPQLPWELMVPVREDGSGERNHLGLEFSISRWYTRQDGMAVSSPPPAMDVEELVLIAPRYDPPLASVAEEMSTLRSLAAGFGSVREIEGTIEGVRGTLSRLPQGIIHFAGHGIVQGELPSRDYAILLEDGRKLSLDQWRGMVMPEQANHPFIFFNACDVGRAARTVDFVDGWAPAMLDAGASAYVGALWPIDDAKAAQFVQRFYRSLAEELSRTNSASVLAAMREGRTLFMETGDPTYLAYVYYGDPTLTLRTAGL